MAEITITRGLSELKLLDNRINRTINNSLFGGYTVGKKPPVGFKNVDDVIQRAKSDYQSINDLITRRNRIKAAIVQSNATTYVEIAGEHYTVAEAIERKTSIAYEQGLLSKLKNDYGNLTSKVDRINGQVTDRLDSHLESIFGRDAKVNSAETDAISKSFKEQNEAVLIDPLDLKNKIEELTQSIEDFLLEVDFVLSESNTITRISIPD